MAIKYQGKKMTANQLAKFAILDAIDSRAAYLEDDEMWENMTPREVEEFHRQLEKRIEGVTRYLGAVTADGEWADWHPFSE